MNDDTHLRAFLRDLVLLLRERGSDAATSEDRSVFDEGREAAYREVLDCIQHQADAFGVPRDEIGLGDLENPLVDPLAPATSEPPSS